MKIGFRIIKTAIGAGLAIFLAQWFGLNFANSSAIITILCIEKTKKKSIQASLNRFFACLLALGLSGLFFEYLGYNALVFSLFIICFLPLLVKMNIQSGFVSAVVIVLHIFGLKDITFAIAENEIYLIAIGIGIAMIINSYMPNLEKALADTQQKVEEQFKEILGQYGQFLLKGDQNWNGHELVETSETLKEAKLLSLQASENYVFKKRTYFFSYFDMREKQYEILERMLPVIANISEDIPQREQLGRFLMNLSNNVKTENTAQTFISRLRSEREEMKELPLPQTRQEFETRASIYHVMNEMEYYLSTKSNFFIQYKLDETRPCKKEKKG